MDLRADVEVHQLEAVEHVLGAQPLDRLDQPVGGEAELAAVAARLDPAPRALRRQLGARRGAADAEVARHRITRSSSWEAVDDDDRRAAELLREQRDLYVLAILVAVADDQGLGVVHDRHDRQQLRLAARLEADVVGAAEVDHLLDHVALLVHLDRIDRAVPVLELVLGDRAAEALAQVADARREDVREADQQRHVQAAAAQVRDQVVQVDAGAAVAARTDLDAPLLVDGDEASAPRVHV
jgi:hypothetical protein